MSFGQEIKDFLGAAAAGQKIMGAASDEEYKKAKMRYQAAITKTIEDKNNDTVGQKLDEDIKRNRVATGKASIRASDASVRASDALAAERAASTAHITGLGKPGSGGSADPTSYTGAARLGAVPVDAPAAAPADDGFGDDAAVVDPVVPRQAFADGGAVEEADEPTPAPPAEDEDEEVDLAAPAVGGAEEASASRPKFSYDAAHDATVAGSKHIVSALGLDQTGAAVGSSDTTDISAQRRKRALSAYAQGAGAMDQADMAAAQKGVDPQGVMGDSERNLAALAAVYQYKMSKGDPSGAQRAAASMIQYHKQAAQRFAAIGAAALEKGDVSGATKAIMKSYANIPDGKDLKLTVGKGGQVQYSYTDEKTGKVISSGIADPSQMAAAAMGVAKGGFDKFLLDAAGQRAEKPAGKSGKGAVDPSAPPAPMKVADRKTSQAGIKAAYEDQNPTEEVPPGGGAAKPKRPADEARALQGAALRIANHPTNGNMTDDEAVDFATKIADPTALGKSQLKVARAEGGYSVTIDGRRPTFVSASDMGSLMAKQKEYKAAATKAAEEAAKPNWASRAASAVSGVLDASPVMEAHKRAKAYTHRQSFPDPSIP